MLRRNRPASTAAARSRLPAELLWIVRPSRPQREILRAPYGAAIIRPINHSLRFGWVNLSFRGAPTGPRKARPDDRLRASPESRDSGFTLRMLRNDNGYPYSRLILN